LGQPGVENVVRGNLFGLPAHAPLSQALSFFYPPVAAILIDRSPANIVGGPGPGEGNVIALHNAGIVVERPDAFANHIVGNLIGSLTANTSMPGRDAETKPDFIGVRLLATESNFVGGLNASDRNIFLTAIGVELTASTNALIQHNYFGTIDGTTSARSHVRAVWEGPGRGNQIVSNIAVNATMLLTGNDNVIAHNRITQKLGPGLASFGLYSGVFVQFGVNNRMSANSIFSDWSKGIGLEYVAPEPVPNDLGDHDEGANRLQNCPILVEATTHASDSITIRGSLNTTAGSRSYQIEFFASPPSNQPQGQTFLGATSVTTGLGGFEAFDLSLPAPFDLFGMFLTATATDPEGNTSEFSNPVFIGSSSDPDGDGSSDAAEDRTPPRGNVSAAGDGNGDGIQDSLQSNVTSLTSVGGSSVTVATAGPAAFLNVRAMLQPELAGPPAGYRFPIRLLEFAITNVPSGSAVVTMFLPVELPLSTVWNYGPTPQNASPHWYEFGFDGTTGAELSPDMITLHFRDGLRGDHDLHANGHITTLTGPAVVIPPGPQLSIRAVGVDILDLPNNIIARSFELSWPTNASNDALSYNDLLGVGPWELSFQSPVVVDNRNVITNTTFSSQRFYRLIR
jgi:hypothetical protein